MWNSFYAPRAINIYIFFATKLVNKDYYKNRSVTQIQRSVCMNCCFHSDGLTVYLSCEPVERQEGRGGGIGEGMEGRGEKRGVGGCGK